MGAFPTESGVKDAVDDAGSIDVHIYDSESATIDPLAEDGSVAEVATVADVEGGTLDEITKIGTLESATFDSIDGTLEEVTTITDIEGGTIDAIAGSIAEVTTIADIEGGTIDAISGSIAEVSTVADIQGGTLDSIAGSVDATVADRDARANTLQSPAANISTGVSTGLADADSYTLYLSAEGGETVRVSLSPNGGTDSFTLPESPIEFLQAGDDVVQIDYDADQITLNADGTTPVQAIVREVI